MEEKEVKFNYFYNLFKDYFDKTAFEVLYETGVEKAEKMGDQIFFYKLMRDRPFYSALLSKGINSFASKHKKIKGLKRLQKNFRNENIRKNYNFGVEINKKQTFSHIPKKAQLKGLFVWYFT